MVDEDLSPMLQIKKRESQIKRNINYIYWKRLFRTLVNVKNFMASKMPGTFPKAGRKNGKRDWKMVVKRELNLCLSYPASCNKEIKHMRDYEGVLRNLLRRAIKYEWIKRGRKTTVNQNTFQITMRLGLT